MSLARRSLQVLALLGTLLIGAASMAVVVTQTTWFKEWLRGFIVRQADDYVNGRLSIGRLDGNLFFGVEMEDVDVTMNGKPLISLKGIGLDYSPVTLFRRHVVVDHLRLKEPTLHLERTQTGWNLAELIKAQTPNPNQPKNRLPITIDDIGVSDGTLYLDARPVGTAGVDLPRVIDKIDASLGVASDANELRVDIADVSLRARNPHLGVNALSGTVRRREHGITFENLQVRTEQTSLRLAGSISDVDTGAPIVNLKASSDAFSVGEIANLVPGLRGYDRLQPTFEVNASGPADGLAVQLNIRDDRVGHVVANLTVDALGPRRTIAGEADTEHFNVAPLVPGSTIRTEVTGHATMNLALPSESRPFEGSYTLKAVRAVVGGYEARDVTAKGNFNGQTVDFDAAAAAYGGHATAGGHARMAAPLAIDLSGQASTVDLRNLPAQLNAPRVASNLQFGYTLSGRGDVLQGEVQLEESTLAGATLAAGAAGSFGIGRGAPTYSARGHVSSLDLQQVGASFDIAALETAKYRSRLDGDFDMTGSGGGRYPLTLDATGTLVDSEMFRAAVPRLEFTTNLDRGDAHIVAKGEFSGLDPAAIADDDRVAGRVGGALDVTLTLRGYGDGVTADSIDASGHVDLGQSTIGGLDIDTALVDGSYQNRAGVLNRLTVDGPDLRTEAHGPIALNDTGSSNLAVHLETPSLDRLGRIVDRSDLTGAVVIDATVTGNGRELNARGTFNGSNVGQGANTALDLDSDLDVTLPNLDLAAARVHARTKATFLELGGQQINELTAETTYSSPQLDFNAVAKQGPRQLSAEGSALLHTDHEEVHLNTLALQTENIVWRTEPDSRSTIQYGNDRMAVDRIKLVNGDQSIEASGTLGSPDETLRVTAENLDMAQIDALMLGDQRLAGRLNANAAVSGTTAAPRVAGDFALLQGAFRNFRFVSFGGKVDYADNGATLDVRLDQDAQSWLTAKGFAPLSLFRPTPESMGHEHREPAAGEGIDIDVASSQVDLGLVQGFTSSVTNVTGMLQARFKVIGSGYDPHLDGAIDIRGGAFTVPDLGMSYTGLDTRIELKPDVVTISEFRVVDDDKHWMTIGGSLAVHQRSVGAVDVKVQSDDFKLINNKTADLKFDTDVHITGTVAAPRVEGTIEIEPGTIDVARVLTTATSGPYSTTADDVAPAGSGGPEPTTPTVPGLFDSMDLKLSLAIPGDLLLKGNNIRPANAPIDVGDMNAYVGGAVGITKRPGGSINVTGEVNTVRGSYTFQGRRFDIMRDGRIRFQGGDVIDPLMDLRARRVISGIETFVHVQGTMRQPTLSFSSNPPQEEADILSLIVFNMPINELGAAQQASLATRAQELAGGYLASGLSASISSALNLDEFEIQAGGERGLGPSVTLGEQVSKGLFVRLRQGFGAEQATEFILEYQLAEYLRLQGTASDISSSSTTRNGFRRVERGGLDLIFFFSY